MREGHVPWHKGATRLRGRPGCLIQSGSECSNYCLDLAHMSSHGEGRTFEPRGPEPPAGRGRGHGSGASRASPTAPTAPPKPPTKFPEEPKFFQSLEKPPRIFQPLEKYFPIIGKLAFHRRAIRLRPPGPRSGRIPCRRRVPGIRVRKGGQGRVLKIHRIEDCTFNRSGFWKVSCPDSTTPGVPHRRSTSSTGTTSARTSNATSASPPTSAMPVCSKRSSPSSPDASGRK